MAMMTQEELTNLIQEAQAELKKFPGVVSVGYGFKQKAGQITDQVALHVYVLEKKARGELKPEETIPADYSRTPTGVSRVPAFVLDQGQCEDMETHSPLIGGISVWNLKPTTDLGTLGFFATINGVAGPNNVVLVSNNH